MPAQNVQIGSVADESRPSPSLFSRQPLPWQPRRHGNPCHSNSGRTHWRTGSHTLTENGRHRVAVECLLVCWLVNVGGGQVNVGGGQVGVDKRYALVILTNHRPLRTPKKNETHLKGARAHKCTTGIISGCSHNTVRLQVLNLDGARSAAIVSLRNNSYPETLFYSANDESEPCGI
jgi:hypothetical protein